MPIYAFFIGAYLVQLRALFVHVFPSSRFQQQQFYLHWINRAELCYQLHMSSSEDIAGAILKQSHSCSLLNQYSATIWK
jgi:hypothetical protein